jgi:hypothetical protein
LQAYITKIKALRALNLIEGVWDVHDEYELLFAGDNDAEEKLREAMSGVPLRAQRMSH